MSADIPCDWIHPLWVQTSLVSQYILREYKTPSCSSLLGKLPVGFTIMTRGSLYISQSHLACSLSFQHNSALTPQTIIKFTWNSKTTFKSPFRRIPLLFSFPLLILESPYIVAPSQGWRLGASRLAARSAKLSLSIGKMPNRDSSSWDLMGQLISTCS